MESCFIRKLGFLDRAQKKLPKIPFSLGLWILFKNQIKPRTQGVKFHSNREHVWSGPVGVLCQAIVVSNSHVDIVSAELHRVAPDIVPEWNQGEALPCMQTII